ncbi:ATP-binding protein [Allocatelliglobosispora scoriae]|uniref:ATP-binding protein n=1 Tax=Allocatelliglobosispora scoriae TaxID=643052 RepID=UPI001C870DFC|nr:tetratricopeptide repeat protein [Allocatelliglobosispora scoriae]
MALLNEIRTGAGLSFRDVARRARQAGYPLPATTVWDMLSKPSLPRVEVMRAFLAACGATQAQAEEWLAARARLSRAPQPVSATPVQPRQLPWNVDGFVGRAGECAQLDSLSEQRRLVVVTGPPGVGKTALALHWAHRAQERYPDGQLYLDLNGYGERRRTRPTQALRRLLVGLGVPVGQVPPDVEHASSALRSLLAGRRVLLLLDNAAAADQVRPLLPGTSDCLVLVTARTALTGLVAAEGAAVLPVPPLADGDARELLDSILGGLEPAQATRLAEACGRLPLALRIAAATLARSSGASLIERLDRLTGHDRLRQLRTHGDDRSAVAVAFDSSYQSLPESARAVFRLLGCLPSSSAGVDEVAAALAVDRVAAADALDILIEENLAADRDGRFGLHDLLRVYARDLGRDADALRRAYTWHLERVSAVADLLDPQGASPSDGEREIFSSLETALAWLDSQALNLEAMVLEAEELDLAPFAWQLADALRIYQLSARTALAWPEIGAAALKAARGHGDVRAEAAARLVLGNDSDLQGRTREGLEHFLEALRLAEAASWREGQRAALDRAGVMYSRLGELDLAGEYLSRAVDLAREMGLPGTEAVRRNNLATVRIGQGRLDDAFQLLEEALRLHRLVDSRRGQAAVLINLAIVRSQRGEAEAALADSALAWRIFDEIGNPLGALAAMKTAADIHNGAGNHQTGLPLALIALASARRAGSLQWEASCVIGLAQARLRLGRYRLARLLFHRGLRLARRINLRRAEIEALTGLADAATRLGLAVDARTYASHASRLARHGGFEPPGPKPRGRA